jgi:hypothetical protein
MRRFARKSIWLHTPDSDRGSGFWLAPTRRGPSRRRDYVRPSIGRKTHLAYDGWSRIAEEARVAVAIVRLADLRASLPRAFLLQPVHRLAEARERERIRRVVASERSGRDLQFHALAHRRDQLALARGVLDP